MKYPYRTIMLASCSMVLIVARIEEETGDFRCDDLFLLLLLGLLLEFVGVVWVLLVVLGDGWRDMCVIFYGWMCFYYWSVGSWVCFFVFSLLLWHPWTDDVNGVKRKNPVWVMTRCHSIEFPPKWHPAGTKHTAHTGSWISSTLATFHNTRNCLKMYRIIQ